ncbi:hypothetical protein OG585_03935 [Streptomyces sp. NBC_01340]|nr:MULTISPECIES: hypothetical protein [unclassified Streptomyces]MCX4451815.1 hypothetical protein [Streptomyces sp. NBC_01719]MCX4491175.1 hypothetical protein [Streptomyces sp. NBC_01728]MCX4594241.1 hypothetical protein [Streptomyces sp. NBC_01549]WSI36505.1 hypothetical protein OG585_03935 [Streptomyces sp. NBC_01340]
MTHTFPLAEARAAFDIAHDRAVASKVLLDLTAPDPVRPGGRRPR